MLDSAVAALKARRFSMALERAMSDLGLSLGPISSAGVTRYTGTVDGFEVAVCVGPPRPGERDGIMVTGGLPAHFDLTPREPASAYLLAQRPWTGQTGDPEFDRRVAVGGSLEAALPRLGHRTRRAAVAAVTLGASLVGGRVHRPLSGSEGDSGEIATAVRDTVELAALLTAPGEAVDHLVQGALRDPAPGIRARCVASLLRHYPDDPEVAAAVGSCLEDPDELVRLAAAGGAGARHADTDLLALAIEVLARPSGADQMELQIEAVRALGMLGGAEAESRLGAALRDLPEPELRVAAARALGATGSIAAIPVLRAALARRAYDWPFRAAVLRAVAAIQQRAVGAAPGQLALAEGAAGEVALVEWEDRGALTLAADDTAAVDSAPTPDG